MADPVISVYPLLSPRLIEVSGDTEITIQETVDLIRDWEDDEANMAYDPLIDAAGKEPLGGQVYVGITAALQNAKIAFDPSATIIPKETGTCTTGNTTGTVLIDSSATFESNGVEPGATVVNFTDGSAATVITVDSEIQLTHWPLLSGTENDWDIGDSYKVWNTAQREVSGGNLVAVDAAGDPMSAIFPTAFTQVVRTASSSATLQELEDIQYASFEGGVTLDPVNGLDTNRGNREFPVKTIAKAQEIAVTRGFKTIWVKGSLTLQATDDVRNYNLNGEAPNKSYIYVTDGCLTDQVHFNHVSIQGVLTGSDADFRDCFISDISGVVGILRNCYLSGTIVLSGTSSDIVTFTNCYLGTSAIGLVEINMNGDGPALAMRPYTGGIRILNKTGSSKVAIDFISGRIELESSITAGTFFLRGAGAEISKNESTGTTIYSAPLTNPSTVADQNWEEVRSEHTTIGTFGATDEWAGEVDEAAIADAVWDEVLIDHLAPGTTGKKLYDGGTGDPAEIAAAVWDANKDDYNDSDTMGELQNTGGAGGGLTPEATAQAVWDALSADHEITDTMGAIMALLKRGALNLPRILPGNGA